MAELTSSPLSIDLSRIAAICDEEWQSFLDDMDATPVPQRQDLRGFFLNWVAVFIPQAFSASLQSTMCAWMEPQLETRDSSCGYVRPPLIGSTLFALTGNRRWLQVQFDNFADGGSQVRNFFHKSLALVAPRISFDQELLRRMDFGMKSVYFYMDVPLALYAVSQGDTDEKLANLRRWQGSFMNAAEKEVVDGFVGDQLVGNPLLPWLMEMTTYVALRLGCFPDAAREVMLPLGVNFSAIWERIQEHPLFSSHIRLKRSTGEWLLTMMGQIPAEVQCPDEKQCIS